MYYYGQKNLTAWLDAADRKKGATKKNVEYMRRLKGAREELKRTSEISYFLLKHLGLTEVRRMMRSTKKQTDFIYVVLKQLKVYRVEKDWEQAFERDIKSLEERARYVFFIIQENIRMTEYYPYFEAEGFEKLKSIPVEFFGDDNTSFNVLLPEIEAWNESHPEAVAKHLEEVREEREATERHRAKIEADRKREKEEERMQKKAEKEYLKQELKYVEEQKRYRKKLEKSFERYWN